MKISFKLNEIEQIAQEIVRNVKSKTLLFYGDMGVGKTTLIGALVKVLGSSDEVSSPTFSIVNEYKTETEPIYHFDMYRIENIEEAYNFGIEDYLDSEGTPSRTGTPKRICSRELAIVLVACHDQELGLKS